MEPASFDQSNSVLSPPPGVGDDKCQSLCVWRGENSVGTPVVISCWKVTKEELDMWQRTGRVWLSVVGTTVPPVALFVQSPFGFED